MRVTLVAPWLARFDTAWSRRADLWPETPALDRWLRFARRESSQARGRLSTIPLHFFGVTIEQGADIPFGALSYLGDGGDPGSAAWIRVDPVHMRADMAKLLIFAAPDVELSPEHADTLGLIVQQALADWGELDRRHAHRWYMKLDETPRVTTTPLPSTVGSDVEQSMPQGEGGAQWRSRINEIQMQLFASEINAEREHSGFATINGVWLWGLGKLPDVPPSTYSTVISDSPLVRGLAIQSASGEVMALAAVPDELSGLSDAEHLVWLDTPNSRLVGDPAAWSEWLRDLENRWANRLIEGLVRGEIERITLHGGDGRAFVLTRGATRRFWRPTKSLPQRIRSSLSDGL